MVLTHIVPDFFFRVNIFTNYRDIFKIFVPVLFHKIQGVIITGNDQIETAMLLEQVIQLAFGLGKSKIVIPVLGVHEDVLDTGNIF